MLIKLGELIEINAVESTESSVSLLDPEILENFRKTASELKKIAPKADDFLYFSAVMMHAAEAAGINSDGTPKLTKSGEPVKVSWDKSNGTWRWKTNDPSIKPYKNCNGDIFPEEELIKAHKKWVHKPLCIDHKSSSVDHTRGFIVDTYYDRVLKRVVALCALDKINYPDLAKKVASMMQTSVSMGTAVGKAICTDCARIARTESDFCDHMRYKTAYGEINVDLNPIELSIVVNGADPKAHIKHIIASAKTLNNYVESKQEELNKLAKQEFIANLNFTLADEDFTPNNSKISNIQIKSDNLEQFKEDIEKAIEEYKTLKSSISNNEEDISTNSDAFNQSASSIAMDETIALPNTDLGLSPPSVRYASSNDELVLKTIMSSLEDKLSLIKESLDKLLNKQEENMSGSKEMNKKAYFQGTEEPTPGQPKYPKDPLNEKLRTDGDKHMEGQGPFPSVGPVDGLHPSPDSVDQSNELERKKMLARAEAEERAMKRSAIVNMAKKAIENKQAYFQGTEEPTPGKQQYPVDKLEYTLREKEDKHMVGQKPFPGVGPVDGLHPSPNSADVSDELKRKEMLRRASLRARFVKAANDDGTLNAGNSSWEVFLGDKLLLTASVDEISGGNAEMLYDSVATKDFGAKLIEKVKVYGADKIKSMIKNAQDVAPSAPATAPATPMAAPEPAPMAEPESAEELPPPTDSTAAGDPKDVAVDLADKAVEIVSDLSEAVKSLTGEQAEMGSMEGAEMGAMASTTLNTLRKELNVSLCDAMKEAIASINSHKEEMDMIVRICERSNSNILNSEHGPIIEDAINSTKSAIADGFKLMTAFVKYARGTQALVKKAEIEAELKAMAETDGDDMNADDNDASDSKSVSDDDSDSSYADSDLMDLLNDTNADLDDMVDFSEKDEDNEGIEALLEEESDADDNNLMAKPDELKDLKVAPGTQVTVTAGLGSKEGRAALRAKLAAEALKTSPHLHEAHPKGGFTTQLDVKPSGNLAEVEDLEGIHDAVMDVATAPPKVRKEAEEIYKLVSEGKLDPNDLDALVAEGLDKDAVSYYKKYFAQVDGGSEFAGELVKEHAKAKLEEELNKFRVKLARAYELAYDMVERDLCDSDRASISTKVDEIMKFNDESFDALKRVVARYAPKMQKVANKMPNVGLIGNEENSYSNNQTNENDIYAQLNAAFSKTTRRLF